MSFIDGELFHRAWPTVSSHYTFCYSFIYIFNSERPISAASGFLQVLDSSGWGWSWPASVVAGAPRVPEDPVEGLHSPGLGFVDELAITHIQAKTLRLLKSLRRSRMGHRTVGGLGLVPKTVEFQSNTLLLAMPPPRETQLGNWALTGCLLCVDHFLSSVSNGLSASLGASLWVPPVNQSYPYLPFPGHPEKAH